MPDFEEIQNLVVAERIYRVSHRAKELAQCYAPDVLTSFIGLIYKIEKLNGLWKIVEMTSINEYDMLAPVIPGTDLKIHPADLKGLRESYKWLAYTRQLAGGAISQDLPGTDRPKEVEKIYTSAYVWLNGTFSN